MTATYTFDVFSSLDGYGAASANWTGYWGKQGPELLARRLALYGTGQRMVSEPTPIENSHKCWPIAPRNLKCATRGSPRCGDRRRRWCRRRCKNLSTGRTQPW